MMVLSTKQLNMDIKRKAKEEFGFNLVCKSFTKIKKTILFVHPSR